MPPRHPAPPPVARPPLELRLKKGSDGRVAAFALHRADGTVTVMRRPHAFFPVHDLTHYCVECTLRHRRAFYGLVCAGWDFEDFGTPWPRGPLPADLDPAEELVGLLDLERATGVVLTAAEMNAQLVARGVATHRTGAPLDEASLARIRERLAQCRARWEALPPGATLALPYAPGVDAFEG